MRSEKLRFFAYYPPSSGVYTVNGFDYQYSEDFRSVKRCREYKNCGFDMIQLRYGHAYDGEEWETSNTNYMWNMAYQAGIKKILVTDLRIERLIRPKKGVLSDVCERYTEAELDALIASYIAPYKDKAGFYGFQLLDEPTYADIPSYGAVARSLHRLLPNAYLQVNLFPCGSVKIDGIEDRVEAYETYVNAVFESTGIDNICFDDYPFRREYILSGWNIRNYQVMARICKARGAELQTVLQSFSNTSQGLLRHRKITESDMYWQTNVAMGFGTKEYAFYTYMPKRTLDYAMKGGDGIDGACFINNDGSRSALYTYTKRIIGEMKKFSKVLLKYEYENSYFVYEKGKGKDDFEQTVLAEDNGKPPFEIKIDKGVALVTEQTNGDDRLFMIENIGNIKDELFENAPPMQLECWLPKGEKTFYFRGESIDVSETDGLLKLSLKVGDAVFVEIKKRESNCTTVQNK